MTHSESPKPWDHVGHTIRGQVPDDPTRTVSGNAWCYTCQVPIEANWTRDYGLQSDYPSNFDKARRKSTD